MNSNYYDFLLIIKAPILHSVPSQSCISEFIHRLCQQSVSKKRNLTVMPYINSLGKDII